ncbi:MAG: toll/interleukin-1 receptor domain-containing protein [Gammaproteobacteria bacterium]|nr:toll/interleukin-1 receptor domain-containing protein [Gammaproteobacteria bacterium]
MNLFISYASEQRDLAERLAIALTNEGHEVFFDNDNLRAGENYNERLREAIGDCDQFIYLISPESVEDGSYARSELQMAQRHFKIAVGRIVPVMVSPTDYSSIPNYAKSVTVLEPKGDVVVAVLNRVAEIAKGGIHVVGLRTVVGGAMLLAAFGIGLYQTYLWAALRMSATELIAAGTGAGLLLLAMCWVIWRRCVLRGAAKRMAAPAALLVVLVAGVWVASAFSPRVVWLLPGTSWGPLIATGNAQHSLLLADPSVEIADIGRSGIYLASNKKAAKTMIEKTSSSVRSVLLAYLAERQVPEQFHEQWLSGWTAEVRLKGQSRSVLAEPERWQANIRREGESDKPAMLNWRQSSSMGIAFIEVNER